MLYYTMTYYAQLSVNIKYADMPQKGEAGVWNARTPGLC